MKDIPLLLVLLLCTTLQAAPIPPPRIKPKPECPVLHGEYRLLYAGCYCTVYCHRDGGWALEYEGVVTITGCWRWDGGTLRVTEQLSASGPCEYYFTPRRDRWGRLPDRGVLDGVWNDRPINSPILLRLRYRAGPR